jgi:hypothetical protein
MGFNECFFSDEIALCGFIVLVGFFAVDGGFYFGVYFDDV